MPEIENTFRMKGILSCHSLASLLNTVFYLNGKNFHLRSYQEHATLRFSQICRFTNPDRYMYYKYGSKTQPGGIADPTAGKLFPFQPCTNTSRCHVAILDFYFSKVPPLAIKSDSHFYMKPMPFTPSGINPWFWDENFSKTKLSTLLKTMMKEANISGNFTNYSLRVNGTTMLFDSGTPEAIIQKCTGHRSLLALRMYERATSTGFQYPCRHSISRE